MPCKLYNNNGFGCGGCEHFVRTNSITLTGGNLIIDISSPFEVLTNGEKICICIAQAIPTGATSEGSVFITLNGGTTRYDLIDKCGNSVRADQIRSRKLYHTHISTDNTVFVVSRCELNKTAYNFPIVTP